MATTLVFNDGTPATLHNNKPSPGDRLRNFVPITKPIGESRTRQSDGATMMFVFRTDYGASFELPMIPVAQASSVRLVDVAARLIAWLMQGGTVTVNTGDVAGNSYTTCGLMPGTTPSLSLSDKVNMEYTLSLSIVNLGSASPLVCWYAP